MNFTPLSLEDFLKSEGDRTTWLVRGMLKEGGYTLVSGPPKLANKSFLTERIALLLATGKSEENIRITKQSKVLVVQEEGPKADAQVRLVAQCTGLGIKPEQTHDFFFMVHMSGLRLFLDAHRNAIEAWCDENKPSVVILDPWSKVGPDDENDASASLTCLQTVASLQRRGISVVIVCHTRKLSATTKYDIDQDVRGSSALTGAYDTHVALRRASEEEPLACHIRNKNAPQTNWWLTWDLLNQKNEFGEDTLTKVTLSWRLKV